MTSTGVTNRPICNELEMAMLILKFILFLRANVTELTCSAALDKSSTSISICLSRFTIQINKDYDLLSNDWQQDDANKCFIHFPHVNDSFNARKWNGNRDKLFNTYIGFAIGSSLTLQQGNWHAQRRGQQQQIVYMNDSGWALKTICTGDTVRWRNLREYGECYSCVWLFIFILAFTVIVL